MGRGGGGQDGAAGGGERRVGMGRGGGGQDGAGGAGGGGQRRDQAGRGGGSGPDGGSNRPGPSNLPIQEVQVRIVWVLGADKKPQPRRIKLGITDGTATEVIEGDLKEGDLIIVGQNLSAEDRPQNNQQRPPGFGGGPGGGPRGPGGFGGGPGRR